MPIRLETIQLQKPRSDESKRPTLIKWKGQTMIRSQSIRASIKEMLEANKRLDVIKVGIVGDQSTGKTTLAKTIGHLIHKMSEEMKGPVFTVRVFGKEEFLNMEETLAKLQPANYILIFDDLSFLSSLANKRQIETVKRIITIIRHLREDVKIFLVYDYHYTLGLDKYLRQADFRYFTSVGSSEEENMYKIVGPKYTQKIKDFQKLFIQMTRQDKATFQLKKEFFSYSYRKPFAVSLFYNNLHLRYVAWPMREWIDPICSICSLATGKLESEIPIDQFCKESEAKFTRKVFMAALKLSLMLHGISVYKRSMDTCIKYIARAREKKVISLEGCASYYGLEMTHSRVTQKLDGVLE